jgi:hypothetical protein
VALPADHQPGRRGDLLGAPGLALLRVPLLVAYQIAPRVRDDDALTQLVGLALDL